MAEGQTIFGVKKNIFALGLVSFFTDVSSEMIQPLVPIFLTQVLGVNRSFVGLIEGVAESTASLLKVFSGWFSDQIKLRKPLLLFGYTISNLIKPWLAFATSGWCVLGIRFIDRAGKGIRTSPRDAMIAESCESCDVGRSFGFHRAADTAGAILGPLLAFILLALCLNNFRVVFLAAVIPGVLAIVVLLLWVQERGSRISRVSREEGLSSISRVSSLSKRFYWFVAVMVLFTLGNSSDAFLILRAQGLGIAIFLIPILWLAFNIIYTVFAYPAGILSDRIGRKKLLLTGFLIYSLVYLGFAFAKTAWHAWLLFAIYGIFYGMTEGVGRAFVSDLVPPASKATAFGIYHGTIGLMALPASIMFGVLWDTFGVVVPFSLGAALSGAAAVLLMLIID